MIKEINKNVTWNLWVSFSTKLVEETKSVCIFFSLAKKNTNTHTKKNTKKTEDE